MIKRSNLSEKENRAARFKTAISLVFEGKKALFLGICEGEIVEEQKGVGGFGYDPVFKPNGYKTTFAEMSLDQKSEIGHRGRAMRQLIDYLSKR